MDGTEKFGHVFTSSVLVQLVCTAAFEVGVNVARVAILERSRENEREREREREREGRRERRGEIETEREGGRERAR